MNDLWDEPVVASRPIARNNEPLFLPSDDEQETARQPRRPNPTTSNEDNDYDNLFAEYDEIFQSSETQKAIDVQDLLAKRAAQTASATKAKEDEEASKDQSKKAEDDKEEKPKPKRTIAKVDEERLLGERGFPALIKEAQKFKPKGKGHEAADLDRLMEIYQFWAHHMFPKTQFRDTVDRVERVCRSRRMLINMSIWRDAEHQTSQPLGKADDSDVSDSDQEEPTNAREPSSPANPNSTQSFAQPSNRRVIEDDDEDAFWAGLDEGVASAEPNLQPAIEPPKEITPSYGDDEEMDAWLGLDNIDPTPPKPDNQQTSKSNSMEVDPAPNAVPQRFLSPPTADNWDEDLFVQD